MIKTSVFARRRVQHHAGRRTSSMALPPLLLAVAATMPMFADAQLLRGPISAAPVAPGPGVASKAPNQGTVTLTCTQTYCSGDTPTTGPGQTLEVLFVSCLVNTVLTEDLFGAAVTLMRGDTAIAGHYLGAPWHPSGRIYIVSQPILLTVPPGHFLRFEAQSLGGALSAAFCTMSGKS
jgi:hypothetical protein